MSEIKPYYQGCPRVLRVCFETHEDEYIKAGGTVAQWASYITAIKGMYQNFPRQDWDAKDTLLGQGLCEAKKTLVDAHKEAVKDERNPQQKAAQIAFNQAHTIVASIAPEIAKEMRQWLGFKVTKAGIDEEFKETLPQKDAHRRKEKTQANLNRGGAAGKRR